MSGQYILAIDQGTSQTKSVIFDLQGNIVSKASTELKSYYPEARFVEQDPMEIYQNVLDSVKLCLQSFPDDVKKITACGISNQRETFIVWDRDGNPLYNSIVWQCKRSVNICNYLKKSGIEEEINQRTGLIIDPYFSGTKVIWLYENNEKIRKAIDEGSAYLGTVDSWLLFKLTKGKSYFTDYTNASRTLFFNINDLKWDNFLLNRFKLEKLNLPQPKPSSFLYGESDFEGLFNNSIKITGMIGDSHAAAFGEGCFAPGIAKVTMGTGSSILMNTGKNKIQSQNGMVTTICWSTSDRTDYALEGIIVTCGATIKWLRDQLGLFIDAKETEKMAMSVDTNNGVYFIPAFSGLGSPYWKMDARASIVGLTLGCNKNHIVRAALESIPYQIKDVIAAIEKDSSIELKKLTADGGITKNMFVMDFLANILKTDVVNIGIEEVSALGAAYMAGLGCGIFKNIEHLQELNKNKKVFSPGKEKDKIAGYYKEWKKNLINYYKI